MNLYKNISDNQLVEKLKKGDFGAFDAVFERYSSRLFGFALKYLKSKEDAEGLVQDVFLKIWENRRSLKKDTSLKSYLFTISYHSICKFYRKKQLQGKLNEEMSLGKNFSVDTEEQVNYHSTLEHIERLIKKLPPKQKIIFEKSRNEGKSSREIAKEMNLSPGTVDNHISAALKFLRSQLSESNLTMGLYLLFFNL